MSLMRRLWLIVVLSTLLVFAGSLFISVWSARAYLAEELQRKNRDNASSLALAMTQQQKDPVMVELQIAALFDTGYYQKVSVADPFGKVISERVQDKTDVDVPAWFVDLFPIASAPGVAQISDGWKQYGVVSVVSHSAFAHRALWEQAARLLFWFAVAGAALGGLGMLTLRTIGRALGDVVGQAEALGKRRFITVPEPKPAELKLVTRAMNTMVERLRAIFADEAARLEALHEQVNHDAVTGLAGREHFMSHLREIVGGEAYGSVGSLVLIRTASIDELNRQLGRQRTDALLKDLARVLDAASSRQPGQRAGRIKGGEFALVCPGFEDPAAAANEIYAQLIGDWLPRWNAEATGLTDLFHLAAVQYTRDQDIAALLSLADDALARAITVGPNAMFVAQGESRLAVPAEQWKALLTEAVDNGQLSLVFYPVVKGEDGRPLHQEGFIRLKQPGEDPHLSAGDFMPMAAKLNLTAPIDLGVVKLAIEHLQKTAGDVAVNLSPETLRDFGFRNKLVQLLKGYPELCRRMLFELPEYGAFRHIDAFCDLARTLQALDCRVGIEYFGQRFTESDTLSSLGLDYIKVHPTFMRELSSNPGNQEFLKGLCRMAHGLGIEVIALGVETKEDLALLASFGFDGATGPAVR